MKKRTNAALAILLWAGFAVALHGQTRKIQTHFAGFYLGGAAKDFTPEFKKLATAKDFQAEAVGCVQNAFRAVPHFNFISLDSLAKSNGVAKIEPHIVFVRGLITRADIKKVEHFQEDEYVISTNVTFEFFDIVTGEVFYTRTLTGQAYKEQQKGKALLPEQEQDYFRQCLKGTIEGLVQKIGEEYQPDAIEGQVVAILDKSTVVVNLGSVDRIYHGMKLMLFDALGKQPLGILKTATPQNKICRAVIERVNSGAILKRGQVVRNFGLNRLVEKKDHTRFMVVGFSLLDSAQLSKDFFVDSQSLGQWLHDDLSRRTGLFMLAPLLVKKNAGEAAYQPFWEAQKEYAISSGITRPALIGHRAFPDVMVRGIITRAEVQSYFSPGADNKALRIGITIEFYDRRTREYLYSVQHFDQTVEKIVKDAKTGKIYRDLRLEPSFRSLCERAIRNAVDKIAQEYRPVDFEGRVESVEGKTFTVVLQDSSAEIGDRFEMIQIQKALPVKDLNGKELEALQKNYCIAELAKRKSGNVFIAVPRASDGVTKILKGDLLVAPGKPANRIRGPLYQVASWQARGKISAEYKYSLPRLSEWLHAALLDAGKFKVMPPQAREEEMDIVEVALSSGEFQAADRGEIISQDSRQPEVLVKGRLGLAEIEPQKGSNEYKNILKLKCGIEIVLTAQNGDTLLSEKLSDQQDLEQLLRKNADGLQLVNGPQDVPLEFESMVIKIVNGLARRIAEKPVMSNL